MTAPAISAAGPGAPAWPARPAPDRPRPPHPPAWPRAAGASDVPATPRADAGLRFDEAELARLAAAAASRAVEAARGTAAALEDRRAAALACLTAALAEAAGRRAGARSRERAALAALVGAVLRAVAAERTRLGDARALDLVARLLVEPPAGVEATLRVDPVAAETLRDRLPELARTAGFAGALELVADPDLAPGGARLVWAEGWVEHAPDRIERLIGQAVAALPAADGMADEAPAAASPAAPDDTREGDDR